MDNTKIKENRKLYNAIRELKPEHREVLMHVYFEEMGYDDVCAVMNKSKGQVVSLLARARAELREHYNA